MTTAFDRYELGSTPLKNRIVMAPMTRSRASAPSGTATALMGTYYAQRASAGLIISEGIQPSVIGQGYTNTPGVHTAEQIASWKPVTAGVHANGGVIYAQLMHTGRIGHPSLLPEGMRPVGPSPVTAKGRVYTYDGMQEFVEPRELSEDEIHQTIEDFTAAARNAIEAGFDGVEIHGANGYLVQQFLSTNANQRTDGWGGSTEGRIRFGVGVASAVAAAIGAERVGFRISPGGTFNDMEEGPDLEATYGALIGELAPMGLAYLHIMEASNRELTNTLRAAWPGTFMLNPNTGTDFSGPEALALVEDGTADLVSFGALFLANPDLPARLAAGGPFNTPDRSSFYGGGAEGYLDYPTLADHAVVG